jgi:hypothetical protein
MHEVPPKMAQQQHTVLEHCTNTLVHDRQRFLQGERAFLRALSSTTWHGSTRSIPTASLEAQDYIIRGYCEKTVNKINVTPSQIGEEVEGHNIGPEGGLHAMRGALCVTLCSSQHVGNTDCRQVAHGQQPSR